MSCFFSRIAAVFTCISILFSSGAAYAVRFLKNLDVGPAEYPRAAVAAEKIILLPYPDAASALTVGSLQGVLANASKTQLLIKDGAWQKYLPYIDADISEARPDGGSWDVPSLLGKFSSVLNGYVLCDDAGAAAAVTVAGVLQAVIIPEQLEAAAVGAGLEKLEDVRGWDDSKLRGSVYWRRVNDKTAVEQPVSLAPKLVDLAVMAGAYFGFSDSDDAKAHKKLFSFLKDNSVVFGWNNTLGEYNTVRTLSELNVCLIPADHGCNYSTLSGLGGEALVQNVRGSAVEASQAHTVCLVMSDGDNLQWITSMFDDGAHYGSQVRGSFAMGWGLPASIGSVAAPMAEYLYDAQTENDEFITQISGLGYTFPSKWNNSAALNVMADGLAEQMALNGSRVACVLDDGGFDSKALDVIVSRDGIDALFYFDYSDYAGMKGAVRTVSGKPVIAARHKLWSGISGCSPEEIAACVNAAPTAPSDPDSYSLIVIHAWSGLDGNGSFVPYGDTMAAVEKLVSLFDSDVRLVTPSEFVSLISGTDG